MENLADTNDFAATEEVLHDELSLDDILYDKDLGQFTRKSTVKVPKKKENQLPNLKFKKPLRMKKATKAGIANEFRSVMQMSRKIEDGTTYKKGQRVQILRSSGLWQLATVEHVTAHAYDCSFADKGGKSCKIVPFNQAHEMLRFSDGPSFESPQGSKSDMYNNAKEDNKGLRAANETCNLLNQVSLKSHNVDEDDEFDF